MSENVGQLFKDWMVATGKSKNTASNYLTGVNTVSNHCGREVLAIEDLDELGRLYQLYGPKGTHAVSVRARHLAQVRLVSTDA
uniref:hypothetical protein n=1 Tax=Pseudomonas aeruginosa TaxID=287 RepID=UPI00397C86A4